MMLWGMTRRQRSTSVASEGAKIDALLAECSRPPRNSAVDRCASAVEDATGAHLMMLYQRIRRQRSTSVAYDGANFDAPLAEYSRALQNLPVDRGAPAVQETTGEHPDALAENLKAALDVGG